MTIPRFIALCGHPKSGKSEVQRVLSSQYAVQPVDDGGPLREIGMKYLGLTYNQVYTQEGKAEYVEILGKRWQVREILGELGNQFEAMFGSFALPFMVTKALSAEGSYSFGSVRRNQGLFYKQQGGVVIGIRNPLAGPSIYEFDKFDESLVDYWIDNDAQSRGLEGDAGLAELHGQVHAVMAIITNGLNIFNVAA